VSGPQKIRFRRGEIAGLDSFPSAKEVVRGLSLHGTARYVAIAAGGLFVLLVALVATLLAVGSITISSDRLTAEAERAVSGMLGDDVRLTTGEMRATFGLTRPFGVELREVSLTDAETGETRLRAGLLRFGVRLLPLLGGELRLTGATVSDASLSLAQLPQSPSGGFLTAMAGEDGMVGADEVVAETFRGLRGVLKAMDGSGTGRFVIEDVELDLGADPSRRLLITRAELAESRELGATLTFEGAFGVRAVTASATIERDGAELLRFSLSADVAGPGPQPELAPGEKPPGMVVGTFSATVTGEQAEPSGRGHLEARIETAGTRVSIGGSPQHEGRIALQARLDGNSSRYELTRLEAGDGRTALALAGAFGPAAGEGSPHYFFNLASGGSLVAPLMSSEPALPVAILFTGRIEADMRRVLAERLVVATGESEVLASGSLDLPDAGGMGLKLAVDVANLPTSHAKNLWPWFGAYAARKWTLENVYGGIVRKGSLKIDFPPGRLGHGVPLTGQELLGHFEVHGARFDMAGTIPPMRDAIGLVDIAGKDVDIGLVSGTVYTENGRTLAARNGSFRMDTHVQPLIGRLALDVEGSADAIAEIADYEPISISRYLKLEPEGMAGSVSGHVEAKIPLVAGAARETLDWNVALSYSGLTVPQAFEGQRLSEGEGTISANPTRAIVEAKGRLNGVPADFSLEEPLGKDKSSRRMIAELQVDDKSREALMPGLGAIISGPFGLTLISRGDGASDLTADLTRTTLKVPWIGWEKKAGVAASASFVMRSGEAGTELTEFSATGDGFSAAGTINTDKGGLAKADFTRLSLRPGDDLSVLVERRSKGGFSARVRGKSADVRSVVSQFSLSTRDGDGGWGATDEFSLDLELDSATGFHGEKLRDLKLVFSGPGTTVGGMRGAGVTASGAPFSINDATIGTERRLELAAGNAGEVLRFLNIYENVRGGSAELRLSGQVGKALSGPLIARNFDLIEEQRLDTVVNRAAPGSQQSLNDTVNSAMDTSRAQFELAYVNIEKGVGYLNIADGVVRGSSIGATFQGTVFDRSGNMLVTGTFMPAYGINRLFGEIPLLGIVLGNGRDRGLIGITFRLHGKSSDPQISINPLSAIAPGIFRKIFEYQPKPMDTGDE
jgi:hypothetical protein